MSQEENSPHLHKLRDLTHASLLLSRIFAAGEIGEKQNLFTLMANFENLFGKQLAEHLKIIDLKNSTLVLKASNSVWNPESEYQTQALIERCNGLLGATCVKHIRFV